MPPSVSINLCCYNSEKYLRETLDSIVSQTYKDWELVIINDGSSDSTEKIIREYIVQDYPIVYHYQENKGIGASRNEALKRSQGEFIAFIDHDDIWLPDKLEKQIPLFHDQEVCLVFSNYMAIYPNGKKVLGSAFFSFHRGNIFKQLLKNNFIVLSTAVVRKAIANEHNGFPHYRYSEEYELFLKIAKKYRIDFVGEPMAEFRYHQTNSSFLFMETQLREILEIYDYWSSDPDAEVKRICNDGSGYAYYGLSRRALFHLKDRRSALSYISSAIKHQKRPTFLLFYLFCMLPVDCSQILRQFVLTLKGSRLYQGH